MKKIVILLSDRGTTKSIKESIWHKNYKLFHRFFCSSIWHKNYKFFYRFCCSSIWHKNYKLLCYYIIVLYSVYWCILQLRKKNKNQKPKKSGKIRVGVHRFFCSSIWHKNYKLFYRFVLFLYLTPTIILPTHFFYR
jgi:fucose permease